MVNYANGKVYKIIVTAGHSKCYIGSTTKKYVSQRMVQHVSEYNRWRNGKTFKKLSSFELFEQFGVNNCSIVLIENISASSKNELQAREQAQIDKHDCVNKVRAFLSEDQRKHLHRNDSVRFRLKHKESITARRSCKVACICGKHISKWNIAAHRKKCKDYAFDKYMTNIIQTCQQEKPIDIITFRLA